MSDPMNTTPDAAGEPQDPGAATAEQIAAPPPAGPVAPPPAFEQIAAPPPVEPVATPPAAVTTSPGRERVMVGYFAALAVATAGLLTWASAQPHGTAPALAEAPSGPVVETLPAGEVTKAFPAEDLQNFRTIVTDTLGKVSAGDQAGAKARITDLESAWDNAQSRLQPMNETAWSFLDGKIDTALKAVRTGTPDAATETQALTDLQNALK